MGSLETMDDLITNRGKITFSFDGLLFVSIMVHVILCPFTKVEESFNMQAIHDLVVLTTSNLSGFDHLKFPGVVPRSFLGAIVISLGGLIFKSLWESNSYESKIALLYASRLVLGLISYLSFGCMRRAASSALLFSDIHCDAKHVADMEQNSGKPCRKYFLVNDKFERIFNILVAVSFHLPFYMSRTLPNTYALVGSMLAMSLWLRRLPLHSLFAVAIVMLIFRCDMLILLGTMALQMLVFGEIPFWRSLGMGVCVALLALALTVAVDSYFWRDYYALQYSFIWPEGIVLFFNTVQNKSSEWGTSPWYWYWLVALPKTLHIYIPLIFCGLFNVHAHGNIINYMLHYNAKMKKYVRDQAVSISRQGRWSVFGFVCVGTVTTITRFPSPSPAKVAATKPMKGKGRHEPAEDCSKETKEIMDKNQPPQEAELPSTTTTASLLNLPLLYYLFPSVAFIALYSWLPHKELRFIMPVLPSFIMAASVGLVQLLPYATLPAADPVAPRSAASPSASGGSKNSSPRMTRVCIDTINLDEGMEGLDENTRKLIDDSLAGDADSRGVGSLSRQSSGIRSRRFLEGSTTASGRSSPAGGRGSLSRQSTGSKSWSSGQKRLTRSGSATSSGRSSPAVRNARRSMYKELAVVELEAAAEKARLKALEPEPLLDTSVVHLAEDDTVNAPLHEIFSLGEEEEEEEDNVDDEAEYGDLDLDQAEEEGEGSAGTDEEPEDAELENLILDYALPKGVAADGDVCRHDEKTNTMYIFKKPTPIDTAVGSDEGEMVGSKLPQSSHSVGSLSNKPRLDHVRPFIMLRRVVFFCLVGTALLISYVFSSASVYNYPGGYAVLKLEDHIARRGLERKLEEMAAAVPLQAVVLDPPSAKQLAANKKLKKDKEETPLRGYVLLVATYAKYIYRPKRYLQYVFQDTNLLPGLLGRDSSERGLAPLTYATSLVTNSRVTLIGSSDKARQTHIHLSADACMTGVTRFLERPRLITLNRNDTVLVVHDLHYSKEEKLVAANGDFDKFDYLVTADVSQFIPTSAAGDSDLAAIEESPWEVMDCIDGFSGFTVNRRVKQQAVSALHYVHRRLLALLIGDVSAVDAPTSSQDEAGAGVCTLDSCSTADVPPPVTPNSGLYHRHVEPPSAEGESILAQCAVPRQISVLPWLLSLKLEAKLYLLANRRVRSAPTPIPNPAPTPIPIPNPAPSLGVHKSVSVHSSGGAIDSSVM